MTLDAAGCQKAIAERIRTQGGDYLVTVEGNQQSLHRACVAALEQAGESEFADCDMASSVEDGHGRHEERYVTVIRDPQGLPGGWTDAGAALVGRERRVKGQKNTSSARYYITSLWVGAAELAGYIRNHWGIENRRSDDRRSDNLCDVGRAGYHCSRGSARVGRVVRPTL